MVSLSLALFKHVQFQQLLDHGKWVHAQIVKAGLETDVVVATALINMFAKCGSLQDTQQIFDKMKVHNAISWTAMINAYTEHGVYVEALNAFHRMQQEGMEPDPVMFICLLKACANKASLQEARLLHASIVAAVLESDIRVRNGLVNMYAKCGSAMDARNAFNRMPERDVVTWSAMIAGLQEHGHGREALELFHQMVSEGIRPDNVTFVAVLCACNHGGLVEKGLWYFHHISKDHWTHS
jgi:pentatricopeptide repeat protein